MIDPRLKQVVAAQPHPLLFATISRRRLRLMSGQGGAHLYGFPSPDSDYRNGPLEMDIVSHDVRKFFGLLLKKNGYVLEQLFSPPVVHTPPEHEELKAICRVKLNARSSGRESAHSRMGGGQSRLTSAATGVITKHHAHHYFGFAEIRNGPSASQRWRE